MPISQTIPMTAASPGGEQSRDRRRFIGRLATTLTALAVAAGLGVAGASPALAHDELVGYTVQTDPGTGVAKSIVLSFNNEIMQVGSELRVETADGTSLTDGPAEIDGRDVRQPLAAPLPEGLASVAWRVVSSDGHPISGLFALTVAADGSAELGDGALIEQDPRFTGPDSAAGDDRTTSAESDAAAKPEHDARSSAQSDDVPVGAVIGLTVGIALVVGAVILMIRRGRGTKTL